MMECRVCGSREMEKFFQIERCPKNSHRFLEKEQLAGDSTFSLQVMRCKSCQLIQLQDDTPGDTYTTDYRRSISFSKSASEHAERFADILAKKYGARHFIEIGCGDGFFAEIMARKGAEVVAFEPSASAAEAARGRGIKVVNSFFDTNAPAEYGNYDSFATRFVLEHVPKPAEFLKTIAARCHDGAVGLIEVPNAEQQIRKKKWFEFFREHTIYFTPLTLASTLYMVGFQILEMHTTMGEEFITVIVRKADGKAGDWGNVGFVKELHSLLKEGGKAYGWGASGAGVTLLSECDVGPELMGKIIDSDPNKWGKYASGSRIEIVSPKTLEADPPDSIIILSTAYEAEISGAIKKLGYRGRIGSIYPAPHWIGERE